jgi:Protein of unknown function (DUF3352)
MDVPKGLPGNLEGTRLMLRAAISLLCVLVALIAAGCGESGSGGEGDGPAALVPADALLYAEAAIRPQGDAREDALAAAGKIMRNDDPAAELQRLFDELMADEGLQWERDFAPWLGEDAAVWASNLGAAKPSFAAIFTTTDAEAARAALRRFEGTSDTGPFSSRSFEGVDYRIDAEGTANGVVDEFVVVGTEDAFRRTVDARDGEKLVDTDRYDDVVGMLEEDRLAHLWMDAKALVDIAMLEDPPTEEERQMLESFLQPEKLGPVAASFQADGDGLMLDSVSTGLGGGAMRELAKLTGFGGTELLGELPGDAWGAWAVPKLGESAKALVSSFAGALGGVAIAGQVKQATGLDLEQDIFSWVGDVGVFVRGADMKTLDGALVIDATDDDRAADAFGKIIGLVAKESGGTPEPVEIDGAESAFSIGAPAGGKRIVLARGEGRVVAAFGEAAAAEALRPGAKLSDSDGFGAAEELLDAEPAFMLSIPDAIALADALGATDAEFDKARPYLEALGVVAGGGEMDGDTLRSRFGVTLR